MFKWIADYRMSLPTAKFILSEDFESIWSASFRWCNMESPLTTSSNIPDEVKQVAYRLIRGTFKGKLTLRIPCGYKVLNEPIVFFVKDLNYFRNRLWQCLDQGELDIDYLSKLYLERSEVIAWCETEQIAPPSFWVKTAPKDLGSKKLPLEGRLRDDNIDQLVCQAIARTYWDIDPNIHPAHMATANALKRYGNGKLYKDENTVKGWIAEVDPRKGQRKTGRPENIPYRIDLETGGLAE